jgi:hypothetical protein
MPYYRIIVWTKLRKSPYQGIRRINNTNINEIHNHYQSESKIKYRDKFIDIEVQMLSKLSKAVQDFIKNEKL